MFGTYQRLGVHVMAPNIAVVRAARELIHIRHRNLPEKKKERKIFYKEILKYHEEERELFLYAYSGTKGRGG